MAEKADSNKKKLQKPAAKQTADKEASGPGHQLQDTAAQIASSLDTSDPEGQAQRLADSRFAAVQRQALAGHIASQQGNRHLSAILAQRAAIPLASTPSIQREALPDIVGQRVGTMVFSEEGRDFEDESPLRDPVALVVETELVPEGQQPGEFVGYDRQIHAHSRAAAEPNICAVVLDRQNKFHALRTGEPGRTRDYNASVFATAHDFRRVTFVNRPLRRHRLAPAGPHSWAERVRRARDWLPRINGGALPPEFLRDGCQHRPSHGGSGATRDDLRLCLEFEFAELLAIALDIDASLVNRIRGEEPGDPNALVNLNLDLQPRGRGGLGHLPHDPDAPLRNPAVIVGPRAFESESQLAVIATAIHESEHGRQALDATGLLRQWRRLRRRPSFPTWLAQQLTRSDDPITQEQHDMALNLWRAGTPEGDPRAPHDRPHEVAAHIEDFVRTYANRPIVRSAYRFHALETVAPFWTACSSQHIKRQAIQRLAAFYRTLDQEHQDDLRARAEDVVDRVPDNEEPFWRAVVDDVV